jgi:two-component system NtrC family response regulator
VDVRIITASSAPLRHLVDNQQFREDLYFRLYVYPISAPSLNERQEDILLLANYFIKKIAKEQNKKAVAFHEEVLDYLRQRQWIGNIRELENFVERLITIASPETEILDYSILPPEFQKELKKLKTICNEKEIKKSLSDYIAEYEEKIIRKALIKYDWNQSKAARALKISEHAIRYKMNKLGINNLK